MSSWFWIGLVMGILIGPAAILAWPHRAAIKDAVKQLFVKKQ